MQGHRRLSIVDLGLVAHQPMTSEDGAVFIWMIYNFLELRQELDATGCRFPARIRRCCFTDIATGVPTNSLTSFRGCSPSDYWMKRPENFI